MFAPRFCKNITTTFQFLFKCPQDDKAKIVRVLNLWQKNGVFSANIIQPLLDMADPDKGESGHYAEVVVLHFGYCLILCFEVRQCKVMRKNSSSSLPPKTKKKLKK